MGWWISKAGRIFQNPDHFEFVKAHPKMFGLPKVVSEFGLAQRQATLDEVIAKGWIRARGDRRQGLTFEVSSLNPDTLFNIREFLLKEKWDQGQKVLVEEVTSGSTMYETVAFFTSDEALAVARNPRSRKRRLARR